MPASRRKQRTKQDRSSSRGAIADRPAPRADSSRARRSEVSIVEVIIDKIKDAVRDRQLSPGQRLVESEIQTAVGASRSSVREALRRLAAEGLIELQHNKGARIRVVSRAEIQELFQTREVLEGLAAKLAADNIGRRDHKKRLLALEEQGNSSLHSSARDFVRYNEQFHALIVRMSESAILIRLVDQLHMPVYSIQFHSLVDPASIVEARQEHRAIVKALLAGDGAQAERLMRRHVRGRQGQVLRGWASFLT